MIVAKYQGKKIPKSYFVDKANVLRDIINHSNMDGKVTLDFAKSVIADLYGLTDWKGLESAVNDSDNIEV